MKLSAYLSLAALVSVASCCENFVECVVALAELPMLITTCAEAVQDFNDAIQPNAHVDPVTVLLHGSDCIAEAFLAGIDLPEHCNGCTKELSGQCPHDQIPCTGPVPPI